MLQRYRVAMVNTEREKLSGRVEVDETQVGGVDDILHTFVSSETVINSVSTPNLS